MGTENTQNEQEKGFRYTPLEIAKIVGEPVDPRKPYPDLISTICDVDTAEPNDYYYHFDVLQDTDKIINITSNGALSQEAVTPDTPTLLSFADLTSPEYYVKVTDLASAKEKTLARKKVTINRALNAYENYKVITLLAAAAASAGNQNTLSSSQTRFVWPDLTEMLDQVQDYGDDYYLVAGQTINRDIVDWDWNDNKFHSPKDALDSLGVKIVRYPSTAGVFQYASDGSAGSLTNTTVLSATKAYLIAKNTAIGSPILFVRKKLNDIDFLGGVIKENGDKPQRLVFVSPNPIVVTSSNTRYLAVGITGYEEITGAVSNYHAISEFERV